MSKSKKRGSMALSLRQLCIEDYLTSLETACASYIYMKTLDSPLLRNLTSSILPTLRNHLENHCPASSGNIREEMMEVVLSGKFPTSKTKSTYKLDEKQITEYSEHTISDITEMKTNAEKCSTLSCSGFYIPETMACVLVSDQMKEIVIDSLEQSHRISSNNRERSLWDAKFELLSILSSYHSCLKQRFSKERKPLLQKLKISKEFNSTQEFSDQFPNFLEFFDETKKYMEYPGKLLTDTREKSDNLIRYDISIVLSEIFGFGVDSFEKLTELNLIGFDDGEEKVTKFGEWVKHPNPQSVKFVKNIGKSCPNLKSFSIRHMQENVMVHLFLEDASCLNGYIQNNEMQVEDDQVLPFRVIDDRLYEFLLKKFPEDVDSYLPNIIKASDLVTCVEKEKAAKKLNKLCNSLQVIDNFWGVPYIPFLLTTLPNIKKVKSLDMLEGLKLMDFLRMETPLTNCEKIVFYPSDSNTYEAVDGHEGGFIESLIMKDDKIKTAIDEFFATIERSEEEIQTEICSDLKIWTRYYKNAISMEVLPPKSLPTTVWKPLETLENLICMDITCYHWNAVSNLLEVIGKNLKKISMRLSSFNFRTGEDIHSPNFEQNVFLDKLLQCCPNLQYLSIDSHYTLTLSSSASDQIDLSKLRVFKSKQPLSQDAFVWLWSKIHHIEEIDILRINSTNNPSPMGRNAVIFEQGSKYSGSRIHFYHLFTTNSMSHLENFSICMTLKNIESGIFLIESLIAAVSLVKIKSLQIQLNLTRNTFESQDEFVSELRLLKAKMEQFEAVCLRAKNSGTDIEFDWTVPELRNITIDEPQQDLVSITNLINKNLGLELQVFQWGLF